MRGALALLALGLMSCTAANPDYNDPSSGCAPGLRTCIGARPVSCDASRALLTAACPTGAACVDGHCVQPAMASPCFSDRDCSGGRICTAVVDSTRSGVISTFCLAPEGVTEGAQPCRAAQECRSALCLGAGAQAVCFRACQQDGDCAAGTRCRNFDVEITGVPGTIRGCQPV